MNLISQTKAAELAKVTKQMINKIKKQASLNFFVGKKVDVDHPDWKKYIIDRSGVFSKYNASPVKRIKPESEVSKTIVRVEPVSQNIDPAEINPDRESNERIQYDNNHALTGGFSPSNFYPETPQQLKALTEVVSKNLDMRIKLGELVHVDVIGSYMDTISQTIQTSFVDLARKVSGDICEKLDRLGLEKEVEKIIAKQVTRGIEEIKIVCNKAKKIK